MGNLRTSRSAACTLVAVVAACAGAQDAMRLEDAVRLAQERNGTVRAAMLDVESAHSRVVQARSAFLPTVTPQWRYDDTRQTGPTFPNAFTSQQGRAEVSASWRLLDAGQRGWSVDSARAQAEAAELNALQTVRQVLFSVHQQFYEALRAAELQRVADEQVLRAKKILEQTEAQVEAKDAPRKDIFQARADYLNATVQALVAKNRGSTAQANLKATIGWEANRGLPALAAGHEPASFAEVPPLQAMLDEGMRRRPDLRAQRYQVDSQHAFARRADRESGVTWSLDANYSRSVTPDTADNRTVTLLVSLPLFDGGRSRAAAQEARFAVDATRSSLEQSERDALAEIESAHSEMTQNAQRVGAAKAALEAARVNFEAAVEAQKAGAAGTNVVTVQTAQVSLVTAESNFVEALYDALISDVRLRVATGQPVPGEVVR